MLKSVRSLFKVEKEIAKLKKDHLNTCGHIRRAEIDRHMAAKVEERSHLKVAIIHEVSAYLSELVENQPHTDKSLKKANADKDKVIGAFRDILLRE